MWFTPIVTTADMRQRYGRTDWTYEIACAQLCGLGHYRMKGYVTVESEAEYATWLAAQPTFGGGGEEGSFWQ